MFAVTTIILDWLYFDNDALSYKGFESFNGEVMTYYTITQHPTDQSISYVMIHNHTVYKTIPFKIWYARTTMYAKNCFPYFISERSAHVNKVSHV